MFKTLWLLIKWVLPLVFIAILLYHATIYLPFISDDSMISLRYANRLIHGEGLRWTPGPPVEGYSNLMWILLVALLGVLGTDLIVASRILGMFFMSSVIVFVTARYLTQKQQMKSLPGFLIGMIFFVTATPVAVWTIGGLEQPLIAAVIAGVIPLFWMAADREFKDYYIAFALSSMLGILCLTRPDGALFSVAILGSILFSKFFSKYTWPWLFVMIVLSMPILCYGGQLIFRLAYYGEWIPNTALVKLTSSSHHLNSGLLYVLNGILALSPSIFLAFVFIGIGMFFPASRKRFVPILLFMLLWISYLVVIGGDIFPAYRHFVPIIVLTTFTLAEGTAIIWNKLDGRMLQRSAFLISLLSILFATVAIQRKNPETQRAIDERWEWQGKSLGLTLKEAFFKEQPLLAVTAAGCLPYWSDFPCLDMLGLNDYYLPRHKPKDFGSGILGHELGDGNYILQRSPDIIIFNIGSKPAFRCGAELSSNSEFRRQYIEMPVTTASQPIFTALIWFKVSSSKIGFNPSSKIITIPAYLMNAYDHTTAFLYHGKLVVGVKADAPAGIILDDVPKNCNVTVVSDFAGEIGHSIQWKANQMHVILTTQSKMMLPVEKILISEFARLE